MKKLFLLLFFVAGSTTVFSQTVTFNENTYSWDQPLLIQGSIGQKSDFSYLSLVNESAYRVQIDVHTHSDLGFVRFADAEGNTGHKITITLSPNSNYRIKSFAYLPSGSPKLYNDELGLDVRYYNTAGKPVKQAYFEIGFTAYLYKGSSGASSFSRPAGYDAIMVGNLPARWNISDLPLTIYSNHGSYGYANYDAVVQKAVNIWNSAGRSIGLSVNFFEITTSSRSAHIQMDWSGQYVPKGALGVAYPGKNIVGMLPLSYYTGQGAAGETLTQELGHLLGIEHSSSRHDIMNGTAHGHWHDLSQIELTERDRQMLGWLYSLGSFHAF